MNNRIKEKSKNKTSSKKIRWFRNNKNYFITHFQVRLIFFKALAGERF